MLVKEAPDIDPKSTSIHCGFIFEMLIDTIIIAKYLLHYESTLSSWRWIKFKYLYSKLLFHWKLTNNAKVFIVDIVLR